VALEKANALLQNDSKAKLSFVAPFFREELLEFIKDFPQVHLLHRPFSMDDLLNKQLVICATDDKELHRTIKEKCALQNLLCNVADTPDLCDFYLGSIVQKGDLKIAISTNGKSPTLAKRIKAYLEDIIPVEIQTSLEQMEKVRKQLKGDFQEKIKQLNELTKHLIK
jgi:siroheme synthase-like protein